jgi:acetyltransferase-like isoleucine patch superfamily enzyme
MNIFFRNRSYFRDLYNRRIVFRYGKGTFIDPEVIIDSARLVKIGSNCSIRKGVVLRPETGEIVIGDHCVVNHYCTFHAKGGIYIGDWTYIGPHCGFYAQNHTYKKFDIQIARQPNVGRGIYLMGDIWVGAHSVICDDVTLGKGVVLGANSTATKSVPMGCVAVGSPAKVIKRRYEGLGDFQKVERTVPEGMPHEVHEHVRKRGILIKELITSEDYVLDVGCEEGIITAMIAENSRNVIGCDYSIEAIDAAQKRYPHVRFVYSNLTNLRFDGESFTKVTFSDVVEHLMPIQLVKTLAEINRVLRRKGELILSTPLTGRGKDASNYSHIYEYSEKEMRKILSEQFSNIKLINEKFGLFAAQKR